MPKYRNGLPQLSGDIFLTDAGVETDLIFNDGIEIGEFATHTLLPISDGAHRLEPLLRRFSKTGKRDGDGIHPRQRYLESTCALGQFPSC